MLLIILISGSFEFGHIDRDLSNNIQNKNQMNYILEGVRSTIYGETSLYNILFAFKFRSQLNNNHYIFCNSILSIFRFFLFVQTFLIL